MDRNILRRIDEIERHQRRRKKCRERLAGFRQPFRAQEVSLCILHCTGIAIGIEEAPRRMAYLVAQKTGEPVGDPRLAREIVMPVAGTEDAVTPGGGAAVAQEGKGVKQGVAASRIRFPEVASR